MVDQAISPKTISNSEIEMKLNRAKLLTFCFLLPMMACTNSPQWSKITEYFPEKSIQAEHFAPLDSETYAKSAEFKSAKTLDDLYIQMLDATHRDYEQKADFRLSIDGKNAWALICRIGPGEASSHFETVLLPFDNEKGEYGPAILLAQRYQDCETNITESWIQDFDKNGTLDILTRNLEYAVPDPEGEYCQAGIAPKFKYEILEWKNGEFEKSSQNLDLNSFKMDAEPEMQKAFLSAGYANMLSKSH